MSAALSADDFAVLVRRAGLPLTAAELSDLYGAWEHVEPLLARIRAGAGRPREAEAALVFRPEPAGC